MAKPSIADALGESKKEPEEDEDEGGEDMDAHGAAAGEAFAAAVKSGDGAAIWDAYKTLHKLCESEYGDEEPGEE